MSVLIRSISDCTARWYSRFIGFSSASSSQAVRSFEECDLLVEGGERNSVGGEFSEHGVADLLGLVHVIVGSH
jgi:hypothetical protein